MTEALVPAQILDLPPAWRALLVRHLSFDSLQRLIESVPEDVVGALLDGSLDEGLDDLLGAEEDDV